MADAESDRSYTLHNTLITALILNRFLRNSDTIGMANYSTFVNINGAIRVHGDEVVRRAQYAAFELFSNNIGDEVLEAKLVCPTLSIPTAHNVHFGRDALELDLTHPKAGTAKTADIPVLDCLATRKADGTIYLSIINKSPDTDIETEIELQGLEIDSKTISQKTIYHDDLNAANTLACPDKVCIREGDAPAIQNNRLRICLKKHSINVITIQ